jgi:hypothetical protein
VTRRRKSAVLGFGPAVLFALAFSVVAAALMVGPADRSHRIPDGAVSRFEAQTLASGRWIAPEPPEAAAFKMSMVLVRDGKRFGKDYPGFALLLAPGERAGLEWLVNPLLGGFLVFGTFLLGRALYDAGTGLVASIVVALSPILLPLATSYLNTLASACLLLYCVLALWRGRDAANPRWAAVGGFLFGWAVATRPYTGALMLLPLALLFVTGRTVVRRRGRFAAAFAAAAIPWGIGMLIWNVVLSGDPLTTPYQMWRPENEIGFGETGKGTFGPAEAWEATTGLVRLFGDRFLAIPFSAWLLVLVPLLGARRVGRRGLVLALGAVALVAGHFFYAGIRSAAAFAVGPRLYGEALPACAVLFAGPLVTLARRSRVGPWALGAAIAALAVVTAARSIPAESDQLREHRRKPLVGATRHLERFVATLAEEDRVIFVDISTYDRSAALLVNEPDVSGETIVAIYRQPAENRSLLNAFPDRRAYLVRWNSEHATFDMTRYVPEEDVEGPPATFPYDRMYRDRTPGRRRRGSESP